jgi:hypothetical protein
MVLQLPHASLAGARPVPWLSLAPRRKRSESARLVAAFRFKNDEEAFARQLARRKSNLWVFRCNQRGFCGDFVVVDMSSPDPTLRPVFVVDLKRGAPLKIGGGGCGVQFKNASRAVERVAYRTGAVPVDAPFTLASGDRELLSAYLCGSDGVVDLR